jgi:hypothetical protein
MVAAPQRRQKITRVLLGKTDKKTSNKRNKKRERERKRRSNFSSFSYYQQRRHRITEKTTTTVAEVAVNRAKSWECGEKKKKTVQRQGRKADAAGWALDAGGRPQSTSTSVCRPPSSHSLLSCLKRHYHQKKTISTLKEHRIALHLIVMEKMEEKFVV